MTTRSPKDDNEREFDFLIGEQIDDRALALVIPFLFLVVVLFIGLCWAVSVIVGL